MARNYPHLDTLLRNNDIPSDAAIDEVTKLLQPLLKDCEDIDTEIQRLDALLKEQKVRRWEMQNTVDQYNIILSPVRRLPPDILHEIFRHCLPSHRNPVMISSEAPLLLTRICSSWRSIAFASPKIWSKLHIPLPGDPGVSTGYEVIRDEGVLNRRSKRFAQLMRSRCAIVREWLSRSGTCPLSLSISYPGYFSSFAVVGDRNQVEEMFDLLVSFAHRWQEIDISMPMKIYENFQSTLSPELFPTLRVFKANLFELHRPDSTTNPTPIQLLGAPNLRRIGISATHITLNPTAHPIQPIWSNLTDIDFLSSITDKYFLDLLRRCSNLVRGRFIILSSWPEPTTDVSTGRPVSLPRLKSLSISDAGHTSIMAPHFKLIQASSLTSLQYQWSNPERTPIPGDQFPSPVPAPVLHFLESSPPLERLVLEGVLSRDNFRECLRLTPKVTHLTINRAPPNAGSPRPFFPFQSSERDFVRPDNIELDVLCSDGADTSGSDAVKVDLIPKLEILEAYDISSLTDERLLRLIASRTGQSRKRGVAQLKRVTVYFLRQRQLDITEEVLRLAQAAGVGIHLDLSYAAAGPKQLDRLSALYGLTHYDQTWSSEIP